MIRCIGCGRLAVALVFIDPDGDGACATCLPAAVLYGMDHCDEVRVVRLLASVIYAGEPSRN